MPKGTMGRVALTLVLLLVACSTSGEEAGDPFRSDRRSNEIFIEVRNQDFLDATVYTARGQSLRRLGLVTGKTERTFRTEWIHMDIQLLVRLIGGRSFRTETTPVSPGETIELIIMPSY